MEIWILIGSFLAFGFISCIVIEIYDNIQMNKLMRQRHLRELRRAIRQLERPRTYDVSADEIKAGDIICYSGHVSIYMGDGRCVHASNSKDGIKISPKWNYTHVITIRRIFND